MLLFSHINHVARRQFGISWLEYGLADMIEKLSTNHSDVPGWCYMSRSTMAEEIGVSKRTVITYIQHLIDEGLVEKNPKTDYLRTTRKWFEKAVIDEKGVQKLHGGGAEFAPVGVQKLHGGGAEFAHYNNINIDIDKNTDSVSAHDFSEFVLKLDEVPTHPAQTITEILQTAPLGHKDKWKREGRIKTESDLKDQFFKFAEWRTNRLVEEGKEFDLFTMINKWKEVPRGAYAAFYQSWVLNMKNQKQNKPQAEEQTVFIPTGLNL